MTQEEGRNNGHTELQRYDMKRAKISKQPILTYCIKK